MPPHDLEVAERLDRYVDSVVAHRPGELGAFDPTLAEAVNRFHAIGRVPVPESAFVARLEARLRQASAAPTPKRTPTRSWLTLPAALLLILLLGAQVLWSRLDDREVSPPIAAPQLVTEIVVSRITLAPGASFQSPAAFSANYGVEAGIAWIGEDDPVHPLKDRLDAGEGMGFSDFEAMRGGRGSRSLTVANLSDGLTVVIQSLIGTGVRGLPVSPGVQVEEIGGGPIPPPTDSPASPASDADQRSSGGARLPAGVALDFWTGPGNAALIIVEGGTAHLSGLTGEADVRRRDANGQLAAPENAEHVVFSTTDELDLGPGDSAMLRGTARFVCLNTSGGPITLHLFGSNGWMFLTMPTETIEPAMR